MADGRAPDTSLAALFATGYKAQFPADAQELISGRAAYLYAQEKQHDLTLLAQRLKAECTAEDGTVYASESEIAMAIAAALDNTMRRIDESFAGQIITAGKVVESNERAHMRDLAAQVQSWKNLTGYGFGIYEFDRAFGGLYPGETLALVGAPGSMKTSLALNAVDNYLHNFDRSVLFFSLDMPAKTIAARRLMRELDAFQGEIYAMLKDGDPKVKNAVERMQANDRGRYKLIGRKRGGERYSWDEIRNIIVQVAPELVIIDYLTCIGDYATELAAVKDLMPKICGAAEDFGISFILLSQMGRSSRTAQSVSSGGHAAGGHHVEDSVDVEIELLKQMDDDSSSFIATVTKTRKTASGRSFQLNYAPRTMEFLNSCTEVRRAVKPRQVFEI